MPRVTPIAAKADVPAEHHAVVDAVLKVFGDIRGPYSILLHSPKVAERTLGLTTFFRDGTIVADKDRSLAILAAVREREGAYVWAAQVAAAQRAGVSAAAIDAIRARGDLASLPAEEREIISYARELCAKNRVSQPVFDALQKRHGTPWLVELTVAANYYGMLCGVVNAFEVEPPPGGDRLPS